MPRKLVIWINQKNRGSTQWTNGETPPKISIKRKKYHEEDDYTVARYLSPEEGISVSFQFPEDFVRVEESNKWVSKMAIKGWTVQVLAKNLTYPNRPTEYIFFFGKAPRDLEIKHTGYTKTKNTTLKESIPPRLVREVSTLFQQAEDPRVKKYTKVACFDAFVNLMVLGECEWFGLLMEACPLQGKNRKKLLNFLEEGLEQEEDYEEFIEFFPEKKKEMEEKEAHELEIKEWVDFLKKYGQTPSEENVEILKDICSWWDSDIEDSVKGFYYKVRNEGTSYFFDSYTSAFDHWDKTTRNKALELNAAIFGKIEGEEVHTLIEEPGKCKKCGRRLNLDEEAMLAEQRYKMPGIRFAIRGEISEGIASGTWTCERCIR